MPLPGIVADASTCRAGQARPLELHLGLLEEIAFNMNQG
jgi:hypothetical protein